jgi:hypothetical protein
MNVKNGLIAVVAGVLSISGLAEAVQTVNFTNITRNGAAATSPIFVVSGDVLKFDASLTANGAANPPGTTGLGLCLEYNQPAVNDPTIANLLATDLVAAGSPTALVDCIAGGATTTPGANFMVVEGWLHFGPGGWPNVALPAKLYDAQFTLPATPAGSTRIGFGASSVAAGETFTSNGPLVVCGKPTVAVTKTADGSETGPTAATFDVTLSAAVPAECGTGGFFPVSLILGGAATVPGQPNADYAISGTNVSGTGAAVTVSFPADGAAITRTVIATPTDDSLVEGTETITLTVAAGSGNYLGTGNNASATITDNDASISVAVTQSGAESGANGTFTFTRAGTTTGALTVNFALTGTAATPADYTVSAGAGASAATTTSITFNAGATTAVLNILVVDDVSIEGIETVILTVGAGAGYSVVGTNPVTMNITDNDVAPVVSVSAKTDGAEPSTNGSFTITRATNLTPSVPLNFTVGGTATRGTDYTLSIDNCSSTLAGNALTIAASQTTVTIAICVSDDIAVEGTETVILTIAAPTSANDYTIGAPSSQTANITDDDGPVTVTIAATAQAAEPATNGQFTVTRTGGGAAQLAQPLLVNLAISGSASNGTDYQTIANTVTIPASQTTATIPVNVNDDAGVEGTETVIVTVQSGTYTIGAPSSATVNITDDDVPISVSIVATLPNAAEPATNGQFTVSRSSGSVMQNSQAYVVNLSIGGTATNGGDYQTIPNTVTILANQTSATIPVTVIDDPNLEGNETVIVSLLAGAGYVVGAPSSGTVTIADDEIGISVSSIGDAQEGGLSGTFRVCRTGSTAAPLIADFVLGGTAVEGVDFTLSGNVGNTITIPAGSACADVTVNAVNDQITNSGRSLTMTLVAGAAQVVPGGGSATMEIVDNDQPTTVPTLSTTGLMLLSLMLATLVGFTARRRRG